MSGTSTLPSPTAVRLSLTLALIALSGATGCWNNVGIVCPENDPACSGADVGVPPLADQGPSAASDLSGLADLADLSMPDSSVPDPLHCRANCPKGCCDPQGVCHKPTTAEACGMGGEQCAPCDAMLADNCSNGSCACGAKSPCTRGQRCLGGMCVCDGVSCVDGCCDANGDCHPRDVGHCALVGGKACAACDPLVADGCGGAKIPGCSCGAEPACAPDQQCVGGVCVCNAGSCPNGCCDQQRQCIKIGFPLCGQGGALCAKCNPMLANACGNNSECSCSGRPACAAGQECGANNTGCTCTAKSCPNGCCIAGMCMVSNVMSCGVGGGVCNSCNQLLADGCSNGKCTCGGGSACQPGAKCKGGACVCDANTCPMGCCVGGQCFQPNLLNCGVGGAQCAVCPKPLADACQLNGLFGGGCSCGKNAPCVMGQQCLNGACQ